MQRAVDDIRPMTDEQAATLKRLAQAAYELDAFKPNLTRNPISNTTPAIAPDKRGGKQDRACVWCGVVAP